MAITMEAQSRPISRRRISDWLFVMCVLVAAMVIVGGATRLTDSGLSITEWKPISGAIPPLSDTAWREEFAKYQTTTEYQVVNQGMSLAAFKEIYWWEWAHRFLGRFIGVAFALPLIFFFVTGGLSRTLGLKLVGLFLLGGLQGALGWWMVTSGLSERVDVSQYRLAAHLALAVILFGSMFWLALDLRSDGRKRVRQPLFWGAIALAGGVFVQVILGAFVAGLRAGRTFNTWPLMDGAFVPSGYFGSPPRFADFFESLAAVQFNHRIGAYLVAVGALWFFLAARKTAAEPRARLVVAAVLAQIALGIWTLLAATPLSLGLLHQAGALAVFAATLYAAHGLGGSTEKSSTSSSG